jgi:hypothetical protein
MQITNEELQRLIDLGGTFRVPPGVHGGGAVIVIQDFENLTNTVTVEMLRECLETHGDVEVESTRQSVTQIVAERQALAAKASAEVRAEAQAETERLNGLLAEARAEAQAETERLNGLLAEARAEAQAETERLNGLLAEARAEAQAETERLMSLLDRAEEATEEAEEEHGETGPL